MDDDLTCCCGCILVIFIIFAGISFFGNMGSDDSTDYSHKNVVPNDYDTVSDSDDYTGTDNNDDYSADDDTDASSSTDDEPSDDSSSSYQSTYVGSVNSDKFHDPSCSQAHRIKDANLITFSSRDDAISSGYSPCGICNP